MTIKIVSNSPRLVVLAPNTLKIFSGRGAVGPQGLAGTPAFREIGPDMPDTAGWAVNELWYDTSTEI